MKYTTIAIAVILAASATAQWTIVNLHPAGVAGSLCEHVHGGQQVGSAYFGGNIVQASLWNGTTGSWINLHPAGSTVSDAYGVYEGRQVGRADVGGYYHAGLWTGTAGSWVDLQPAGARYSTAHAVDGSQQVGYVAFPFESARASLWSGTAGSWVDLNPDGAAPSYAYGVHAGQQVGSAMLVGGMFHASLWTGSASSWVDLHPPGASNSYAWAVHAGQQVGYAVIGGTAHASLWAGTAGSWVDLHPVGSTESYVWGVHGGQQVGMAVVGGSTRASLWNGTVASWVDLHAFLPAGFASSEARGIWHNGDLAYVVGHGQDNTTARTEALMWVSRSVAPTSFSMFRGSVFSGNLASLQNSDDNRLVMRPGITLGTSQPPIQIILNATAPTASPDGFSFSLESSASFGNAQQKISLYNFTTGLYEELDARLAKTTDDTVTVTVRTNPSRFIEPGTRAIRALVTFRAVGPSLSFPWSGRIDKVWWNFPG